MTGRFQRKRAGTAKRWVNAPTIRELLSNAGPSGPVSLQHHGAAVWFKKPEDPAALTRNPPIILV